MCKIIVCIQYITVSLGENVCKGIYELLTDVPFIIVKRSNKHLSQGKKFSKGIFIRKRIQIHVAVSVCKTSINHVNRFCDILTPFLDTSRKYGL